MMEMARPASVSYPGTRFDRFLFASVGEDERGGSPTVVSTLARLDLDPWLEAAKLSVMSERAATERMATLLRASPGGEEAVQDSQKTAARLIRLLPGKRSARAAPAVKWSGSGRRAHAWAIILFVLVVGCIFGEQMLTRDRQPPRPGEPAHTIGAGLSPALSPAAIKTR